MGKTFNEKVIATGGLQIPGSAGVGKVPISDSSGNLTLQAPAAAGNGYQASHAWDMQETSGASLADRVGAWPLVQSGGVTLDAGNLPGFAASAKKTVDLLTNGRLTTGARPADMASYGFVLCVWVMVENFGSNNPIPIGWGTAGTGMAVQCYPPGNSFNVYQSGVGNVNLPNLTLPLVGVWARWALWVPPTGAARPAAFGLNGSVLLTNSNVNLTSAPADSLLLGDNQGSGGAYTVPQARFARAKIYPCTTSSDAQFIAFTDYLGQIGVIPN